MASMIAIGILTDRWDVYDEAVTYFKHGAGNGAIAHAVWKLYPEGLGQVQESGRDQGHSTLVIALLGAFCQMAWNQHDDLFGYDDDGSSRARNMLRNTIPAAMFLHRLQQQRCHSGHHRHKRARRRPAGMGASYNHYVVLGHMSATYIQLYSEKLRPEG
jgi:hypothetical protein